MARADELMDLVGLDPAQHGGRYPRSRVANASASGWPAPSPPTRRCCSWTSRSARSTRWSGRLQEEFLRLQRDLRKTVMLVTHDIDEAVRMGDRVAVFAAGGRLAQYDVPAQILGSPADDFVAEFVGSARGCASRSPRSTAATWRRPTVTGAHVGGRLRVAGDALATMMRYDEAWSA